METNIKPFGNNILVKPHQVDTILKSTDGTLCEYGEVVAVGDEVQKIQVGDIIGYTVFGVNSLQINDTKHYFIPETSEFILGTIELAKKQVLGGMVTPLQS